MFIERRQVDGARFVRGVELHSVDASVAAVPTFRDGVVAMLRIVPINEVSGSVGNIIVMTVGDEEQFRGGSDPNAIVADLQSRRQD